MTEFRVNTFTAGNQRFAAVAMDADGDFVVVWESNGQDGSGLGVYAQRYDAAGAAQGSEFRVNTVTSLDQRAPSVAMDADGDFVVTWASYGQDGALSGVYAQRYSAAGEALGGEFQVNTFTSGHQRFPSVAMDADGDFVVAWQSYGQDGSFEGVYAQRFNAAGVARDDEFRVNTVTAFSQREPSVAMDADGDFVVAWASNFRDGSEFGVYAQRYNAAGVAQGDEFRVNTFTAGSQGSPSVAMDADGGFVVTWVSDDQDGSGEGIYAQRFSAAGVAQGIEFRVNTTTASNQRNPAVAMEADGDFVVTWQSYGQDGSRYGVYAQRYNAAGVAQGDEFLVNITTAGNQREPSVAMDADGDLVVAWQSYGQDGSVDGVYARRFAGPPTLHLAATDAVKAEGTGGSTGFTFTVTRTGDASGEASADWAVVLGTATGTDFAGGLRPRGSVTFAAGETSQVITVNVAGDSAIEMDEAFTVTLSRAVGATLGTATASGTILNDDAALFLAATEAAKAEGNSGSTGFTFLVTRAGDVTGTASANWSVSGAAVSGADFVGGALPTGTVTFAAGEASQVITVNLAGDTAIEANEAFTVTLSGAVGAALGTATATATILNDDAALFLTATDAAKAEGNGAGTAFTFTVLRAGDLTGSASVSWAVSGTAVSGADFVGGALPTGTVTFAAGEASQVITVNVAGDRAVEANEAFTVTLSRAVGATLGNATASGTIQNDDGVPTGRTEFRVNTTTARQQFEQDVAMDGEGDFVVTWTSDRQDGLGFLNIYAQRYDASGVAQGVEFRVNSNTGNNRDSSAVAMDADGDFVVTWESYGQDGSTFGIYAQRYNAAGVAQGDEFRVNVTTAGSQILPAVAMDADGDFVVTWTSPDQDGSSQGVFARRYSAAGVAQGSEFRVNTATDGAQWFSQVAMASNGDFVVTWRSDGQDGSGGGIYAQRFEADGSPQGGEFRVNTTTIGQQVAPSVSMSADGDFVVAWLSPSQGGVFAQRYTAGGLAQGGEFRVNTTTGVGPQEPDVAMDANGDFVVTWESFGQDGSGRGIYAQRFTAAGVAQGGEFRVNTTTANDQTAPAVAMDADGNFVVAWASDEQDGSREGVYAQRYDADGARLPLPVLNIRATDAAKAEGQSGSTAFTFLVTRSGDTSGASSASWAVVADTASAADFAGETLPSGTVTFAVGETSQVITVNVIGDMVFEASETFTVTLSGVTGATVAAATASGTIRNDDALLGGAGNDALTGGADSDTLLGGAGDDTLLGQGRNDLLLGEAGNDSIDGGAGNDSASGGVGNDTLLGRGGDDALSGGEGNDVLNGGAGNDILLGEAGDDVIHTGTGADIVHGGAGRDRIISDVGGEAKRFLYLSETEGRDAILHFERGTDRIALQFLEEADLGSTEVATSFGQINNTGAWMVFVAATETLWVDMNGTGAGERYAIARLVGIDTLASSDIDIGL